MNGISFDSLAFQQSLKIKFDIFSCAKRARSAKQLIDVKDLISSRFPRASINWKDPPLAGASSAIQPGYESKRIERVIRRRDDGIKQSATADGCSGFLCTGVNTHTFYCGVEFLIIRKHFFVLFHPKVTLFLFYFPLLILNWCFTFMSFPLNGNSVENSLTIVLKWKASLTQI